LRYYGGMANPMTAPAPPADSALALAHAALVAERDTRVADIRARYGVASYVDQARTPAAEAAVSAAWADYRTKLDAARAAAAGSR
jgi:hypothetical protein